MYAGNKTWSNILLGIVIFLVFAFTLMPIWPVMAKTILWYISVTFLIFMLSFCSIRFIAFLCCWIFGYEFWILPNLFDEEKSFEDSFKPFFSFHKGATGQGYYRVGLVVLLIAFAYWAMTQPTPFDTYQTGARHFIDDLYSGKLLADVAQEAKDNVDKVKRGAVPQFDELMNMDLGHGDTEDGSNSDINGDGGTSGHRHGTEESAEIDIAMDNFVNSEILSEATAAAASSLDDFDDSDLLFDEDAK